MCAVYIIQSQARDCWLAIAEDRHCNTARCGLGKEVRDGVVASLSHQGKTIGLGDDGFWTTDIVC